MLAKEGLNLADFAPISRWQAACKEGSSRGHGAAVKETKSPATAEESIMSSIIHRTRIEAGSDKKDASTRIARAKAIETASATSALYQGHPEVKSECDALIEQSKRVAATEATVASLEVQLSAARSARAVEIDAYDAIYGVCTSKVERYATSPAEVQGAGFDVLQREKHALAAPTSVDAWFEDREQELKVRVMLPVGMSSCVVDVSNDASEPRQWTRLPGVGRRQSMSRVLPGTYFIRAATVRAHDQSAFTTPVSITVK